MLNFSLPPLYHLRASCLPLSQGRREPEWVQGHNLGADPLQKFKFK